MQFCVGVEYNDCILKFWVWLTIYNTACTGAYISGDI